MQWAEAVPFQCANSCNNLPLDVEQAAYIGNFKVGWRVVHPSQPNSIFSVFAFILVTIQIDNLLTK